MKSCSIAIETGKEELALDLVSLLCLEKSVDTTFEASERENRRGLSDRIHALRSKLFFIQNHNHDDGDDEISDEYLRNEFDDTFAVPESISISSEIDAKKKAFVVSMMISVVLRHCKAFY